MDWKDVLGKDFGDKVMSAMKELAHGLGIAAEHVYIVLVKQQFAYGLALLIGCLLGLIILGIGLWKGARALYKHDAMEYAVFMIFPISGFVLCVIGALNGMMHIANPEYYAIREIMDTISGSK